MNYMMGNMGASASASASAGVGLNGGCATASASASAAVGVGGMDAGCWGSTGVSMAAAFISVDMGMVQTPVIPVVPVSMQCVNINAMAFQANFQVNNSALFMMRNQQAMSYSYMFLLYQQALLEQCKEPQIKKKPCPEPEDDYDEDEPVVKKKPKVVEEEELPPPNTEEKPYQGQFIPGALRFPVSPADD